MKLSISYVTCLLTVLSPIAQATIMGDKDDRVEMYELSPEWREAAKATLAIAPTTKIVKVRDQWKTFSSGFSLSTDPAFNPMIHPRHRFATQPEIADCTGFLINPDTMVTAAHCMPDNGDYSQLSRSLVISEMGYTSAAQISSDPLMLPLAENQIAQIEKPLFIGKPSINDVSDTDFAIVKLKTPIFNVKPVVLERNFTGDYPRPVSILGYQLGLPLKADLSGKLAAPTDSTQKTFRAFLDTGGGNSGGPVFNTATRGVIGIFVSSSRDWTGCEPTDSGRPQYSCEALRPETMEQLEKMGAPRKTVKALWRNYPNGIITAWASSVVRIDAVADKLTELGIQHEEK